MLEEAYRPVTVGEGDRKVTLPIAQAVIRRLTLQAAQGEPRAQRLFIALVHNSDRGRELAWPRLPSSDHLAIRHPERRHSVENLAPRSLPQLSVPPTLSLASLSPR